MSGRGAGVAFWGIAAFLVATRSAAAAIFGSGVKSREASLFGAMPG